MRTLLWPKRPWLRLVVLGAALLIVPFLFSRLASSWRSVSTHSLADAASIAKPSPSAPLRIACYNIAHGRGLARSNWSSDTAAMRISRLNEIAILLKEIDADVVVLNEVDFDCSWSYSVNQARHLARHAGYSYLVEQRNIDARLLAWKWRFGNAVLSKHPITDAQLINLPGYSLMETILAGKKRSLACVIQVGDQSIRVIATHLSHRSEALRATCATLLEHHAAKTRLPVFVAGDLNSSPPGHPESETDPNGRNAFELLANSEVLQSPHAEPSHEERDLTYHSAKPSRTIDWILIPKDWQYLQYRVKSTQLSDHRPVIADVAPIASLGE